MAQETIGGFDALRIRDYDFTVTIGGEEVMFETPKDTGGRIIAINGNGKNRLVTYAGHEDIARGVAGVEFEQVYTQDTVSPVVNHVGIETADASEGIYRLTISSADCTLDPQADPFFFFNSWEGVFENYVTGASGSVTVTFTANPSVGNARVTVGVGDDLGKVYRKTIMLGGAG